MKRSVQFVLITVFYLLAFISCTSVSGNDDKKAHTDIAKTGAMAGEKNTISFDVNGQPVSSSGWNISRSIMMDKLVLNVTSNMHTEPRAININVNGDTPGTYKIVSVGAYQKFGFAYGNYYPDYVGDVMEAYQFEEGEFTITSIDTTKGILDANFSGTAKNYKGESLAITNGKVREGQLKPGIARY